MRKCLVLIVLVLGLNGCTPKVEEVVKDEVKPVITSVQYSNESITVNATDNVGIVGYLLTINANLPELNAEGWQSSNIFSIDRNGRFFFWAKDLEGNISEANSNAFYRIVAAAPFVMKNELFDSGLMGAKDFESDLWGYVDVTGEFVIAPQYDTAYSFMQNGLATVEKNGKYLLIDKSAKVLIGPIDDELIITENGLVYQENSPYIYDFTGALAYVLPAAIDGYSDNHWYKSGCTYYDETGKIMLEYKGTWTCHNFVNGMAFIQESGSFGEYDETGYVGHYIDTLGNKVIDHFETPSYEETIFDNQASLPVYGLGGSWESFYFSDNGTAVKKDSNGLMGYVNKTGEWVISPKFAKAGAFNESGVAVIATKSSSGELVYGLINTSGKYVVSPKYELIWKYYSDYAIFRDNNGNLGYLNTKGSVVIKPNITWASANSFLVDGYAAVKNGEGLWGVINKSGKFIIDYKFSGYR